MSDFGKKLGDLFEGLLRWHKIVDDAYDLLSKHELFRNDVERPHNDWLRRAAHRIADPDISDEEALLQHDEEVRKILINALDIYSSLYFLEIQMHSNVLKDYQKVVFPTLGTPKAAKDPHNERTIGGSRHQCRNALVSLQAWVESNVESGESNTSQLDFEDTRHQYRAFGEAISSFHEFTNSMKEIIQETNALAAPKKAVSAARSNAWIAVLGVFVAVLLFFLGLIWKDIDLLQLEPKESVVGEQ